MRQEIYAPYQEVRSRRLSTNERNVANGVLRVERIFLRGTGLTCYMVNNKDVEKVQFLFEHTSYK